MSVMDTSRSSNAGKGSLTSRSTKPNIPEVPLAEKPTTYMHMLNKLSNRGLCIPTPPPDVLDEMEDNFVNDGVVTERARTRFKDTLLPRYDGKEDIHCKAYFKRPDVKKLISITTTVKPGEKDVKRSVLEQERHLRNRRR